MSELHDLWKSVEVKASTSEHNASWNTVGFTSPSTSPLRYLISFTSPRPVFFSTLPPYKISIIVRYCAVGFFGVICVLYLCVMPVLLGYEIAS
ncbi:hypothetical protein E2C01_085215 [Portunus trituberculatus]|uniref:Uncharacterized protein n=1 Tax=Portunus trituberculatus TaxID=210409 RepID=A0A5B7J657_PORTR|nr:hypothetical protein [Portunus trituberculatus]